MGALVVPVMLAAVGACLPEADLDPGPDPLPSADASVEEGGSDERLPDGSPLDASDAQDDGNDGVQDAGDDAQDAGDGVEDVGDGVEDAGDGVQDAGDGVQDAGDAGVQDAGDAGAPGALLGEADVPTEGGTVHLGTLTLEVPSGALGQATKLRAFRIDAPPSGTTPAEYYVFEPSGLTFPSPITVRFPLTGPATSPVVLWSNAAHDGLEQLETHLEGGAAVVQTAHFSTAVVTEAPPSNLCGNGTIDVRGHDSYCASYLRTWIGDWYCARYVTSPIFEQCDDGNANTNACAYGQTSCTVCRSDCTNGPGLVTGYCGDVVVNGPEACDDGNAETERCPYGDPTCIVCRADCTSGFGLLPEYCGDGTVNGPEACDDGNFETESCAYGQATCTVCRADCTNGPGLLTGYCGDGTVNGPEACDDGNANTNACTYGQTSCALCRTDCTSGPGLATYCGDGAVNGPETCDDANTTTETCAYGVSCTVCRADCTNGPGIEADCGDGIVNGSEDCDDGNRETEACPGGAPCTVCRADCTLGPGTGAYCGNGIVESDEECDGAASRDCAYYGYLQGNVTCNGSCRNDTSQCEAYSKGPVATSPTGAMARFGGSSHDGRAIVWLGDGQGWDGVDRDPPGTGTRIYLHLRHLGISALVRDGETPVLANGEVGSFSVAENGSLVSFSARATNIVTPDANGTASDCLLWDPGLHAFQRIPSKVGTQPVGACTSPELSRDGRYVALSGSASDFGGVNGGQYYLYDRFDGTFEALDVGAGGVAPDDLGAEAHVALSADARFAVFVSAATNLVAGDTNGKPDVFLRDRIAGTTTRVSVKDDGSQLANGATKFVASASATMVAFFAERTDFFGGATGPEVFVRDVVQQKTTYASPPPPGQPTWPVWLSNLASVDDRGAPFFGDSTQTYAFLGGNSVQLLPPGPPAPAPIYINAYYTKDEKSTVAWTTPYDQAGAKVTLTFRGRDGM